MMRQSNPFVKPLEEETKEQPWLYWETFDTDKLEQLIDYHYEAYRREYDKWKTRLYNKSRITAQNHLMALSKLTHILKMEIYEQRRKTPRDMKQRLEDPDYGETYEEEKK